MPKLVVVDTETSGLTSLDKVLELGFAVSSTTRPFKWRWSSLIKPGVPVHPAARANHHITDEELKTAPSMRELLRERGLPELSAVDEDPVLVGHNIQFDVKMMEQSGVGHLLPTRRICTLKCAREIWPEQESFSNQVLRYALKVKPMLPTGQYPHRAEYDAAVTEALLHRMLRTHTVEDLVRLSNSPLSRMPFGKYKGTKWRDLDIGFLRWLLDPKRVPPFESEIRDAAQLELGRRMA